MAFNPLNPNGSATSANSQPVVIASDQATIPVSLASVPSHAVTNAGTFAVQATLAAETTKVIGVTRAADGSGNLITSTGNALDINIKSGNPTSITANAGTNLNTSALALDATLTGGTQQTKITDGTNVATVKAASTAAIATDKAVVVAVSPNNSVAVTGTFWQATQPVSGTVTTSPPSNASTNIAQINGVTPLMGNGVTGTGSQRVTIASDNTAFSVNATLSAETTKVIGVVRNSDGAGNLLTSNSTTYTAKFGLDGNLLGTLGTAFSTAGKVDVKGADGDVFVRQATGTNLHTVVDSGTITTVTTLTGITNALPAGTNLIGKVGIDQTTPGSTNGVTPVPAASGGPTVARIKAAASTNATSLKASAGQIYGYALYNNTASAKFFKVYNKASSPTVGTDTPAFTVIIPASGGANIEFSMGIPLGTGVAYAITGAVADSDTTSTAADDVHGVLLYK